MRENIMLRKRWNKVFGIGYNKTGTTTLAKVLATYGFTMPNQKEQELRLTHQVFSNSYYELKSFVQRYDAFQDLPFSQGLTFAVVDALFPESKFILTERNSESWYNSLVSSQKKLMNLSADQPLTKDALLTNMSYISNEYSPFILDYFLREYTGCHFRTRWDRLYEKSYFIDMYERRNNEIKRFFSNSEGKLLVIDVTVEKTTEKICHFLNIPLSYAVEMPWENRA